MSSKEKSVLIGAEAKKPPPWRSSLYEEPLWVSLAWIIGPTVAAGLAIFFAVR